MPRQANIDQRSHSTEVQEIIGRVPSWILRFGTLLIFLILLLLAFISWLVKYPELVETSFVLNSDTTGIVNIPQQRLYRVKPGQAVLIRFAAYPAQEYGYVEGKIDSISDMSSPDSTFGASVQLTSGLFTNYKKKLIYRKGMVATAQIVTADQRLSQRLLRAVIHGH